MRAGREWFLDSRSGESGYGRDVDGGVEQEVFGQRKQGQLNSRGKRSGVGHTGGSAHDPLAVQLRQAVDEVVGAVLDTVVAAHVDDAERGGEFGSVEQSARMAMGVAAEEDVDIVEIGFVGEAQICLALHALMDFGEHLAAVQRTVDPCQLHVGMVDQETYQLSRGKSVAAQNTRAYHDSAGSCMVSMPRRMRAMVSLRPRSSVMSNMWGPLHSPTTVRRKAFMTLPR